MFLSAQSHIKGDKVVRILNWPVTVNKNGRKIEVDLGLEVIVPEIATEEVIDVVLLNDSSNIGPFPVKRKDLDIPNPIPLPDPCAV